MNLRPDYGMCKKIKKLIVNVLITKDKIASIVNMAIAKLHIAEIAVMDIAISAQPRKKNK